MESSDECLGLGIESKWRRLVLIDPSHVVNWAEWIAHKWIDIQAVSIGQRVAPFEGLSIPTDSCRLNTCGADLACAVRALVQRQLHRARRGIYNSLGEHGRDNQEERI